MKKISIFTIITVAFVLIQPLLSLSAKVTAKAKGDSYMVRIYYKNAKAESVGLVGDMQDWNLEKAMPMKKNAKGVWSITLKTKDKNQKYLYKFNVDGQLTEDPKASLKEDDGSGGNNGLIDLATLLK